jgi:hypothetical protein
MNFAPWTRPFQGFLTFSFLAEELVVFQVSPVEQLKHSIGHSYSEVSAGCSWASLR